MGKLVETINRIGRPLPRRAIGGAVSAVSNKQTPAARSCIGGRIQINDQNDAESAFLRSIEADPLPFRLARALADAVRTIRQDPVAFVRESIENGAIPRKKRSRTVVGIAVAVVFYAVAFSVIYASYSIPHREKPSFKTGRGPEIAFLPVLPLPVMKAAPELKPAEIRTAKNPLPAPTPPAAPSKADLITSAEAPRPMDQAQPMREAAGQISQVATGTHSPAGETASAIPASGEAGSGAGTSSGTGGDTDGGRGLVASAGVNCNEVFSVTSVTTRPKILGRAVPAYTEEARRAQVEGAVKLSVVLNANGSVSDIRVVRGLGYGLDEKAIEAARQLRFVPAQKDGHTVGVRVTLEFKFSLL